MVLAPGRRQILDEAEHGNRVLFLSLDSKDSGKAIDMRFNVQRIERGVHTEQNPVTPDRYLRPERFVPDNETFQRIARQVVEGKTGDLVRARALYDHVIDRMRYAKFGDGWGKGDAVFACDSKHGNCTDFHSYFIALARAVGFPARFAIGAAIPSSRDAGGVDGYHCWAEVGILWSSPGLPPDRSISWPTPSWKSAASP